MTSRQALTELFNEANRLWCEEPKYTTYDLWEMCKQIQKDLEVLEILENRINLKEDTIKGAHFTINEIGLPEIETDTKDYDIAWVEASGFVFKNSKEYKLLKEWLETNTNSRLVGCIIDNNCVEMNDELKEKFKSLKDEMKEYHNEEYNELLKEWLRDE